jgi:hypothetical protein
MNQIRTIISYFLNIYSNIILHSIPCLSILCESVIFRMPTTCPSKLKGKAFLVTGHEGPWGCETSRLTHFRDNRLIGDGEVASLKRRQPFTRRKITGTHFYYKFSRPQGHSAAGRVR